MPYRKTVSIEIGPDQIRAVELMNGRKKANVFNVLEFDTPPGCVDNGYITNVEKLGALLRQNLGEAGILTENAVFSIISEDILVGGAEITIDRKRNFEEDVKEQARELFGLAESRSDETEGNDSEDSSAEEPAEASGSDSVSIDDYYIDYIEQDTRGKVANTIIYAAPIDLIDSYSELAEVAQLTMEAADYSGNSLLQWMFKSFGNDAVMMVDLRKKGSTATIITDGLLRVQVDMVSRTDRLIEAIRSREEAAEMEGFMEDTSGYEYGEERIVSESGELVEEINSIAAEFLRENVEDYIDRIVLSSEGEGSLLLAKQIRNKTGIETLTLEDLSNRALVKDETPFQEMDPGDFLGVIGAVIDPLQFSELESQSVLSSGGIQISVGKDLISRGLMITVIVCLFATAALCVTYFVLRSHNKALESSLDKIRYIEEVYSNYQEAEENNSEIRRLDRSTEQKNELLSQLFSDLESKMPSNSKITSMNSSDDMVTFSVRAGDKESAAQFILQFRKIDYLSDIEVSDLSDTKDSSQKEAVDFTISAYLTGNVKDDYEKSDGANDDGIDYGSRQSSSSSSSSSGTSSSVSSAGTSGTAYTVSSMDSLESSDSTGTTGTSGSSSTTGTTGTSNASSTTGTTGTSNASGTTGTAGTSNASGSTGTTGTSNTSGSSSSTGQTVSYNAIG